MLFLLNFFIFCLVSAQVPSQHLDIKLLSNQNTQLDTDEIGRLHNEAVEYILTSAAPVRKPVDRYVLRDKINAANYLYFKGKGIELDVKFDGQYEAWLPESMENICLNTSGLSQAAVTIACAIQDNYNKFNDELITLAEFVTKSEELRVASNSLPDGEKQLCGITASIGKHSAQFWSINFERFYTMYEGVFITNTEQRTNQLSGPNQRDMFFNSSVHPFKVRWGGVVLADMYGAWNWGRFGFIAGGGVGTLALGFAGAAYHSGSALVTQAALRQVSH